LPVFCIGLRTTSPPNGTLTATRGATLAGSAGGSRFAIARATIASIAARAFASPPSLSSHEAGSRIVSGFFGSADFGRGIGKAYTETKMQVTSGRPAPPAEILEFGGPSFIPAPELETWARDSFIEDGAPIWNEEHAHLQHARIGFLWTAVSNARGGHRIVGQCELMPPMAMGKWQRARAEQQVEAWFGVVPDFLVTLDAHYASHCDDAEFCSLVEHEMLHAGQERDPFGAPRFLKSGKPKFAVRGHDVEEFVSIVRRYGVGAAAGATRALVEAASRKPEVGAVQISQACGTCRLLRAA
jgi:hypothetical protein